VPVLRESFALILATVIELLGRLGRVLGLTFAPLGPTLVGLQVAVALMLLAAPWLLSRVGAIDAPADVVISAAYICVLFGVAAMRLQRLVDRPTPPPKLVLSFGGLSDPDCYEARGRNDDPDLETWRVGVVNSGSVPVKGVTLEVIRLWGSGLGYGKRPLRHKNDHLVDGEYRESIAGITVRPNGNTASAYFDVVHKFRRHIPDPRYKGPTRLLDQVLISYADDDGRACAVPDNQLTGLTLRLRSNRGEETERSFAVVVDDNRRLYLKDPGE
jgi:hypothetical protein